MTSDLDQDRRVGRFRCSELSMELGETQEGTASTVASWLLVEQPGPWGYHATKSSRMPREVARHLRRQTRALGVRLVLIRRPRERREDGVRCFAANTAGAERSLWSFSVPSIRALADVDVAEVMSDAPVPFGAHRDTKPLFLVCTNGRRDPCCAERGRPVFSALARVAGDRVWECSHIGGDRFAANVVWFPEGVYYGRVQPSDAERLVTASAEGRLLLDLFRGRTDVPMVAQAAEAHVRRELGLDSLDGVTRVATETSTNGEDEINVTMELLRDARASVVIRVDRASLARFLTCRSGTTASPPEYGPVRMSIDTPWRTAGG